MFLPIKTLYQLFLQSSSDHFQPIVGVKDLRLEGDRGTISSIKLGGLQLGYHKPTLVLIMAGSLRIFERGVYLSRCFNSLLAVGELKKITGSAIPPIP